MIPRINKPSYLGQYSNGLWAGQPGFDSWQGQDIFLYPTMSRTALGPTQPPSSGYWGFSHEIKWLEHEADYSPPSSHEVKNCGAIPPLVHVFMVWCLIN
jgi:hypothetical protein